MDRDSDQEAAQASERIPVIVITGPVGAGKSTTGVALSDLLGEHGVPHGMIDVDHLRWCYPAPPDDPFHEELGRRNLAAVSANYRAVGATCLVLVDVVEHRAKNVAAYERAIPGASVTIVRLRVPMEIIHQRLRARELGSGLEWHLNRAPELERIFDANRIEDFAIDCADRAPDDIAREIARRTDLFGEHSFYHQTS